MTPGPEVTARLFALFDELVDLDSRLRAARLDALRRDEPTLAASLARMFAADAADGGPVDSGLVSLVAALAPPGAQGATGSSGRVVGRFVLERPLGHGGMGEVWLARRRDGDFAQSVALKLLRTGARSDDLLRRFARERRILAALAHPGIARFIDGGVGDDGQPWYAMEYVDGVPLTDHAAAHALGPRDCVALVAQVADAVAYAQNHLVVHRDLKPSNVLVDRAGRPCLLDFGIAKILDDTRDAEQTATGVHALSPAYAAPEQILGTPISAATDVYALGVVLFELLTGELPHQRRDQPLPAIAAGLGAETAERPSARLRRSPTARTGAGDRRDARRVREVDGELDTIVQKCLRGDPARRYASAAALADDLRRWLDGRPVQAKPDTASYRLRKFVTRHRLAVGSASAVLLALVAGFGTALWQADVARRQAELARSEAVRAQTQAELARRAQAEAETINQFFSRMLYAARATDQAQGVALTVKDWVLAALPRLDQELATAPAARASLRRALGSALASLGDHAAARAALETAVAEGRAAYGESPQLATALQQLAVVDFALGDSAQARAHAEAALALLDRLPTDDESRNLRIQARTTLLRVHSLRGDTAAALGLAERNLADRAALYGPDDPRLAVDHNNLSGIYNMLSRLGEAEAAMRRTLELLERNPARPVARIAFVHQGFCSLLAQRADYERALASCARAATLYAEALGPRAIELASVQVTEARVRLAAGETGRARELLDAAEPRLRAAGLGVELREIALSRLRLAVQDRDWARLHDGGTRLLGMLPEPPAGVVSSERSVAEAFAALGRFMHDRDLAAAAEARGVAERLLAREDAVAYFRASAALAAAVAAQAAGDRAAADTLRRRAVDALATHMPAPAAEALWQRWLPREPMPES
jgi:tRNA A-37 threonylcarbamoyl transferase component Bud32/tetratricopeptide (TPR) repeat protein